MGSALKGDLRAEGLSVGGEGRHDEQDLIEEGRWRKAWDEGRNVGGGGVPWKGQRGADVMGGKSAAGERSAVGKGLLWGRGLP